MEYPQFPDYIQDKITNEFLATFLLELDKTFYDAKPIKATYWDHYQYLEGTLGYKTALEESCNIHNFNELTIYLKSLDWEDSDYLTGELTKLLYLQGIIEEGEIKEFEKYH
jgi:hypothetical protein